MVQNPKDADRRVEAEYKNRLLFIGPESWPKPGASFGADAQQRILSATRLPLCEADSRLEAFWRLAAYYCLVFAKDFQSDLRPYPTTAQVKAARAATIKLIVTIKPILGHNPDFFRIHFLKTLDDLVTHIDKDFKPRQTKPRRAAGRKFISKMMKLFTATFKRPASEAPDGYFASFVIACLNETQGLPEPLTGEWVQKLVSECNAQKGGAR